MHTLFPHNLDRSEGRSRPIAFVTLDLPNEVRNILNVLAFKLLHSTESLSGLDVGMALFGLQNMETSTTEVQAILGILLHKIRTSNMVLQLSDLSLAIVGILRSSNWIKDDFLKILASRTKGMNITIIDENFYEDYVDN